MQAIETMRKLAATWLKEGSVHQQQLGRDLMNVCDRAEKSLIVEEPEAPAAEEEAPKTDELPPDEELERLTAPESKEDTHEC